MPVGRGGVEPPTVSLSGSRTNLLCYRPVVELLRPGKLGRMAIIVALLAFAIAALIAFTSLGGISVMGLVALGLFFLALHFVVPERYGVPWRR